MTEEIKNDIDKLDGMTKIKGKCGYEIIGGCSDLRRLEQENKELKEMLSKEPKAMQAFQIAYSGLKKENEVLWGMVKDYKTALEEIRILATKNVSIENFVKI